MNHFYEGLDPAQIDHYGGYQLFFTARVLNCPLDQVKSSHMIGEVIV